MLIFIFASLRKQIQSPLVDWHSWRTIGQKSRSTTRWPILESSLSPTAALPCSSAAPWRVNAVAIFFIAARLHLHIMGLGQTRSEHFDRGNSPRIVEHFLMPYPKSQDKAIGLGA